MTTMTIRQLETRLHNLSRFAPDAYVVLKIPQGDYSLMARLESVDIEAAETIEDKGILTLTGEAQG